MALKQLSSTNPTSGLHSKTSKTEQPLQKSASDKKLQAKLELLVSAGRGTVFGSRNWLVSQNISSTFGVELEAVKNYNRYLHFEEASATEGRKPKINFVRLQSRPLQSQKPSAPMSERISRKNSIEKNKKNVIPEAVKKDKVNIELVPISTDSDNNTRRELQREGSISKLQISHVPSPAHRRSLTSPSLTSPVTKSGFQLDPEPPRIKDQLKRVFRNPLVQTFRKPLPIQAPGTKNRHDQDTQQHRPQGSRTLGLSPTTTGAATPRNPKPQHTPGLLQHKLSLDWRGMAGQPATHPKPHGFSKHLPAAPQPPEVSAEEKSQFALFQRECFHTVRKFKRIVDSRQYGLADPLAEMLQVQVTRRKHLNQVRCAWAQLFMFVRVLDAIKRKKIMFRVVETFKNYKNIKFEIVVKKAKAVAQQKLPFKLARDQLIVAKALPLVGILLEKPTSNLAKRFACFMLIKSLSPLQIKASILKLKYFVGKLHLAGKNMLQSRAAVQQHLQQLWAEAYKNHFSKKTEQPQLLRLMESLRTPVCQFIYEYYESARTADVMFAFGEARNPKQTYSQQYDGVKVLRSLSRPSVPEKRYVYDLLQEHLEKLVDSHLSKPEPGSATKRARTKSVGTTVSVMTTSSKGSASQKKSGKKGGASGTKKALNLQIAAAELAKEREAGYGSKYTSVAALVRAQLAAPSPVISCHPFRPLEVFAHIDIKYMSSLIALLHERESKIRSTWGRVVSEPIANR